MRRHPILAALLVAVAVTLALAVLAYAIYPAQQAPWAMTLALATFPFTWFFAWLVTNGIGWWRETTGRETTGREKIDDEE